MRIHLKTLGCRLNEAETESWARDFQNLGHRIVGETGAADLVVINTCAVTSEAAKKSRKLMNRIHRDNPQAKLVVSGCYASLDPDQTAETFGVDLVVNNQDKDRLVEITGQQLHLHTMPQLATVPGAQSLLARGRQRAFIKVQDGCRYQCTFCIVTTARGEERSRPISEVIDEINQLTLEGIKEVVLTGVHIGGYGSDIDSDLYHLIEAVLRETEIPRLRLGAVEPWDLPESFWGLFKNPRFMPHLHLPLQSGADSVLKRMARRCKADEFTRLVELSRQQVPNFNLTTDIIIGFPGETDAEWQQTMDYVSKTGFGHLHIFAYSHRPGTRAADMPDPIHRDIIRQRSQALHQLGENQKRNTLIQNIGTKVPVLIEGLQKSGHWGGYTPNFLRVEIATDNDDILENRIINVQITGLTDGDDALMAITI